MKRHLFLTVTLVMFFLLAVNAFAATRYVATNGNNKNPGTKSQPWRNLAYAAANISNGDTVIVRGGTYKDGFTLDVDNVTFQNYPNETPIIDGEYVRPAGDPDEWGKGVTIRSNNVTLDGFVIKRIKGSGLQIYGYKGKGKNATIKNCEVYECQRKCLILYQGADNALIEDCDFHHGAHRKITHPWEDISPATVSVRFSSGAIFRRCKIRDSYYEGFNLDNESSDILVEYCEIYGNPKNQLYMVCSKNNVIRYNLIYGTDNGKGQGIWISVEPSRCDASYDGHHKIYGNLVANTKRNLWLAGGVGREIRNCIIYNNTFVESSDLSKGAIHVNQDTGSGHVFKNNIIWQTNGTIANVPSKKITCDYNLWSKEPDNDIKGLHDPAYALPKLIKTSGWNNLKGGDLNGSEFALQQSSPAINGGTALGAEFDDIPECNNSVWPSQIILIDQDNQGHRWEIGADIHVVNASSLEPPTNLKIATEQ